MAKTAAISARIDPELKDDAEAILQDLGMTASGAITMFYRQVVLRRGPPFEVVLPPHDASIMQTEQLEHELQRGYDDYRAGRVQDAGEFFEGLLRPTSQRGMA